MENHNETFGAICWATEDLENALDVNDLPVTEENVANLFNALNHHSFTDCMISAGWDYIYELIFTLKQRGQLK